MGDATAAEPGWTKLGTHTGRITSLLWSPQGTLFSASSYGEIRRWSNEVQTIRTGGDDQPVTDLAWSSSQDALIASVAGKLTIYRNGSSEPTQFSELPSTVSFRADRGGYYLASSEMQFVEGQANWWLRVRKVGELSEAPLLSMSIGNLWGRSDFAWHPTGRFLAILFDSKIKFASVVTSALFSYTWWVGPLANAVAWISDDELVVASGDANVRIYSRARNEPSYGTEHRAVATSVLEAHEHPVVAVSVGWYDRIVVTADLSGRVDVWSTTGKHLARLARSPEDSSDSPIIAVHPSAPTIALAHSDTLYQYSLGISPDDVKSTRIGVPRPLVESLLIRLLRRSGTSPPERLTSDDCAERWEIGPALEVEDQIPRTLQLRRIATSVRALGQITAEAMIALWNDLERPEIIAFENEDLATVAANEGISEAEVIRGRLRKTLVRFLASKSLAKRHLALCAYSALGYVEQAARKEMAAEQGYSRALDQLEDDELRPKLKARLISAADLRSAEQTADLLDSIVADLRGMLENLPGKPNSKTRPQGTAMVDTKKIENFIVIGAQQELAAVRECLDELGFARERKTLQRRLIETFELERQDGQAIVVGVMVAHSKGKTGMKSLTEFIKAQSRPRHVIMVGMMAGIKGKSKLLDVLVPPTIYDLTAIGTYEGKFVSEPEFGKMDETMHAWTAGMESLKYRDRRIKVTSHKKTVTFSAKIDDIKHKLAKAALRVDNENVIGLEMEGSALAEMQSSIGRKGDGYLMIKGIADYAGERPDEPEVTSLKDIPSLAEFLADPDPTKSPDFKQELQREATCRALVVALELLRTLPP